jgi:thiol-disulfide isomerase/thioredoxin
LYVQVAAAQGDTARLRDDLTGLMTSNPKEARYPYYLGLTKKIDGKGYFAKALELDPEFAPALVALANLDLGGSQPNLPKAKERLLQAARSDPGNLRAFLALSQLYRQSNDPESRLLALRRCIEIDPESKGPRQALFQALQEGANEAQKNGSTAQWAEQTNGLLEEIAGTLPGQASLLYTAARIWMSVNEPERAFTDLQAAVAAGFDDPLAIEADGAFASMKQSGKLQPLITQAAANRIANESSHRRELRAERLDLAAPDFELPRQGGGSVKLSELRGKVVILDFWATWCGPCRKALPSLQTYYESKHKDVEVFCVNVFERDGGKSVEPFWKQNAFPMPVLLGTQETAQQFAVQSIPTLFVIGPDGRIGYRHQGFDPYLSEQLRWMAEDLLGL